MKKFSIHDRYMTYWILGGFGGLIGADIALSVFFVSKSIETGDVGFLVVPLTLWIPTVVCFLDPALYNLLRRLLIRCEIDNEGIHCFGLFQRRYHILWKDIRSFGLSSYSYSYLGRTYIFFSKNQTEVCPVGKSILEVNEQRIVFEFQEELWTTLCQNLPPKFLKKLSEAVAHQQECFYRV